MTNVNALAAGKPLTIHKRGGSLFGRAEGPILVALGHGHEDAVGLGPNLPGAMGWLCWCCCCMGLPCSTPYGPGIAKMKYDLNVKMRPQKGKGMSSD